MTRALDLDGLERLAKGATPGPWRHYSHGMPVFKNVEHLVESQAPGANEGDSLICVTNAPNNRDAAFIAAANPETVQLLIAAARERDGLRALVRSLQSQCENVAYNLHQQGITPETAVPARAFEDIADQARHALTNKADGAAA